MDDILTKNINEFKVNIIRPNCIGSGNCVNILPELFQIDDMNLVKFNEDESGEVNNEKVVEACSSCPVQALEVEDEDGKKLIP